MPIDKHNDDLVACPSCDHLFDLSGLQHREKARCSRCDQLLSTCRRDAFTHVQAYAMAGLVFFVMSCSFPFLSFKSKGLESVMTLPQTISQLSANGMWELAIVVACFIMIIPAVVLLLAGALGASLDYGWRTPWSRGAAKLIFLLQNWSMVEVFFIAVLVSLVKIAHMATVVIGISFWAYAAFSICFTLALSNLDTYQTWKRIEELQP